MPSTVPTPVQSAAPQLPEVPAQRATNVVMASHGRGPWYTPDGKNIPAYVIGIAGGSSSGKVSSGLLLRHS